MKSYNVWGLCQNNLVWMGRGREIDETRLVTADDYCCRWMIGI